MQNPNQVNQLLLFRRLAACRDRNINLVNTLRLTKIAQRLRTPRLRQHHRTLPHPQPMNRLRSLRYRRKRATRERKTDPHSKNDGANDLHMCLCAGGPIRLYRPSRKILCSTFKSPSALPVGKCEISSPKIRATNGYKFTFSNGGTFSPRRISGPAAKKIAFISAMCAGS